MNTQKKVFLIILDGYGEGKDYFGNAITNSEGNYIESLREKYPSTLLKTDGEAVGLPKGTMGGSEVGHFTIGSGRITWQTLESINRTIDSGEFEQKEEFLTAINKVKNGENSSLHLMGMISDAGVHSHLNHLFALLKLAKKEGLTKDQVYIHAITDGRDVPEKCAKKYLTQIQEKTEEVGVGIIATIIGRFYAMDRDTNWDRTQKAYELFTQGKGDQETDPLIAIDNAYQKGAETDYYIEPIILDQNGLIKAKDAVINFNYRSDRMSQITLPFTDKEFHDFDTEVIIPHYVCFGPYSKTAPVAFPPPQVAHNLGEVISNQGLTQVRIAETEKYPHVTFFFNSQVKTPYEGEKRILVNSPKVPSYAEKPEMSAREITTALCKELDENDNHSLIVLNYANPDLVGHSGDLQATKESVEVVNDCLKKAVSKGIEKGYDVLITADHGNAEYMVYEDTGEACPSHTLNKVIFILVSEEHKDKTLKTEATGLRDVAPTILDLLNISAPEEMTGSSLINP